MEVAAEEHQAEAADAELREKLAMTSQGMVRRRRTRLREIRRSNSKRRNQPRTGNSLLGNYPKTAMLGRVSPLGRLRDTAISRRTSGIATECRCGVHRKSTGMTYFLL